jgi:hypothetical protein
VRLYICFFLKDVPRAGVKCCLLCLVS